MNGPSSAASAAARTSCGLASGRAKAMLAKRVSLNRATSCGTRATAARNDAWVPQLEARLALGEGEDTLAVVGALHLLGEDGVVEKLRAKGYEVERVCSACAAGTLAK